jgi:tetratricopeptide (TPR) repeat protein
LTTLRLVEVGGMVEIAVAVRRVENGRLVFTQSFSADATEPGLLETSRVAEFVCQTAEAIEAFLLSNTGDDIRSASRLILSAAHRIFCIKPTDLDVAERQLKQSFALDPCAIQLAWLAMLECIREGETRDSTDTGKAAARRERVDELTARALEMERGNSLALALLGHANAFVLRDYDFAHELISDALSINRYRAIAWASRAMLLVYSGEPAAGYEAALRGRSLGRTSPYAFWYNAACGIGASLNGRYQEAVRYGHLVARQRPEFKPMLRHLFASEAALGDIDAATRTLQRLLQLEPNFSPGLLDPAIYPVPSPLSIDLIRSGLQTAGGLLPQNSEQDDRDFHAK